jgi:hypothetical protein
LCWGANKGLTTNQISAFRIALVVRGGYDQVDPGNWKSGLGTTGADPIPAALHWVRLIPSAASMLDLPAVEGRDYHSLTGLDAFALSDLGYKDGLIRLFLSGSR